MPALVAQLLRFAIIALVQSGIIIGVEAILNPLIEKAKEGIQSTFNLGPDDAMTYVANFILDTLELAGLTVVALKSRLPLKVADKLGFTARGFTRGALPAKVSTGASAPGAIAKAAVSAGPVTLDTISSGIAATKNIGFSKVQSTLVTIAAVVGGTTFTMSTIGNWIDFGNWNSGAYQGTFQKIFAVFGLQPDVQVPKSTTVSDDVWNRVYNTYKELGAYAITDPYKLQSVVFSKQALIDLVDKVGAQLNAETGSAPAKSVLGLTHALVLIAANGGTGGSTGPATSSSTGTTKPATGGTTSSVAKVLTGIVSQGVLQQGLTFTARPDDLIESAQELQDAASNNLAAWLAALPSKIVYEVKIVSTVTTKDGFTQHGATQQIANGTFANGTVKYKTVTNKFAVIIIYAITDKGTRTKLTQITLGPTNSAKLTLTAGQLDSLAAALPSIATTTDLSGVSNVSTPTPAAPATATASNAPSLPSGVYSATKQADGTITIDAETKFGRSSISINPSDTNGTAGVEKSLGLSSSFFPAIIAYLNAAPTTQNTTGLYQLEKSDAPGGTELIYYPPGMSPDPSLRAPGAPAPSPTQPASKPGANATSLAAWYAAQGLPLAPVSERALIYQGFGLGQSSFYTGTAEQNAKLLAALQSH